MIEYRTITHADRANAVTRALASKRVRITEGQARAIRAGLRRSPRRTVNRNVALIVAAIVCFVLAAIAAASADGEVILNAGVWIGLGSASFAAAHLPA